METTVDAAVAAAAILATALVVLQAAAGIATQTAEDFEKFNSTVNAVLASELLINDPARLAEYDEASNAAVPQAIDPGRKSSGCFEIGDEQRCEGLSIKRLVFAEGRIEVLRVYA
jgi:hypothetical protein